MLYTSYEENFSCSCTIPINGSKVELIWNRYKTKFETEKKAAFSLSFYIIYNVVNMKTVKRRKHINITWLEKGNLHYADKQVYLLHNLKLYFS
jgi:hypothetical protein